MKSCSGARILKAELDADKATERFAKTRSHKALIRMQDARTKALAVGRR